VPATFFVTNSTDNLLPGSLRYALTQANLPGNNGSTIEITPQVSAPIALHLGELPIAQDMTIRNDSGAPLEIRQTTANSRVFHVGSGAANVTFTGVSSATPITIDGGSVIGNGGGMLLDGSATNLTLDDVQVQSNRATADSTGMGNGGGIYQAGGTLTLIDSSVSGNKAPEGEGGGINMAVGSVIVTTDSHVDGNSAKNVGGIRVGNVVNPLGDAVEVLANSTVDRNASTATVNPVTGDFGGGGIAAETFGNVVVSASEVSDNHTVGMYSGGIVVGLGDVTVTDGSRIDSNTNNGPGGGIAANFGGTVTVSDGSQVDYNTGAAIGGGIVNFSGPGGSVTITGNSQVDGNDLRDSETLGQAIAVFLKYIQSHMNLSSSGTLLRSAEGLLSDPGHLVVGGGIGSLAAPIYVTDGSEVNGNFCDVRVQSGHDSSVGLGGGVFSLLGRVEISDSAVDRNFAPYGDGGGIYNRFNLLQLNSATIDGNISGGNGGGIWNSGVLVSQSSTISDNTASLDGGGLYNARGGLALIVDSAFTGNTAGHHGGGIANKGHLLLIDTIFSDNTPDDVAWR
jgi:predicted outer membrane repeat protein